MNQQEWENIFRCISDPSMVLSPDHRILKVNNATLAACGLTEDKILGHYCYEIFHKSEKPPVGCPMETLKTSKQPENREMNVKILNGTFLVTASPVFNEDGQLTKVFHISRDIAERKQVEKELIKSEERFQHFFELANMGFALTAPGKGWVQVNQYLCNMLGYTKEELFRRSWSEIAYPEDLEPDTDEFHKVLTGEIDGYGIDKSFIRKDGELIHTHLTVSCIRNPDGSVYLLFSTLEDITGRKTIEGALWESEERFRTMVEQSPFSIQIISLDGVTIMVNKAWEKLWGVTIEDLKGYNILKDKQLEELGITPYLTKCFSGEATFIPAVSYNAEETIGKGTERWVQAHVYPVKDEDGNIRSVVLMHDDITKNKSAEEEIKKRIKELERFYEMSVGRELKMKELKKRLAKLEMKLSRYKEVNNQN